MESDCLITSVSTFLTHGIDARIAIDEVVERAIRDNPGNVCTGNCVSGVILLMEQSHRWHSDNANNHCGLYSSPIDMGVIGSIVVPEICPKTKEARVCDGCFSCDGRFSQSFVGGTAF